MQLKFIKKIKKHLKVFLILKIGYIKIKNWLKCLKNFLIKEKLLILHGLMIQNYLIKLTMMLLIDIVKTKNSTELLSIQDFLDDINNEYIENKDDASEKFKNFKNDVKSDELKDIVKELERAIFGNEELSVSGLKILTDKQMLNRLPILLAQIQAGNNSNKLKK